MTRNNRSSYGAVQPGPLSKQAITDIIAAREQAKHKTAPKELDKAIDEYKLANNLLSQQYDESMVLKYKLLEAQWEYEDSIVKLDSCRKRKEQARINLNQMKFNWKG